MAQRDSLLDHLRGIAIIWVVIQHLVTALDLPLHPLLWGLTSFEMPLLFFVSGASLHHYHKRDPAILTYLLNRCRRLLPAYFGLAAVCAALFYLNKILAGESITPEHALGWILLSPSGVVPEYVGWGTWFIPVALIVSGAHVLLVRAFETDWLRPIVGAGLGLAITAFSFPLSTETWSKVVTPSRMPQFVAFYAFFFYLGYYLASDRVRIQPTHLLIGSNLCALCWSVLVLDGLIYPLTFLNKFPPNMGFALTGLMWLGIWLWAAPHIRSLFAGRRVLASTFRWFGVHSYEIYLWHGFAVWALVVLVHQPVG